MSKGQSYLTVSLNLQSMDNLRLSLFLLVLGGRNRSYLDVCPPYPLLFGRGGRGRWLAGSFLVLHPYQCARGGGTALTHDNLSYDPSSTILELYIPDDDSISN
jgi:hypothetical protein